MNGWMPMLNLAFNDYNMSGENKLLLTNKGTVLQTTNQKQTKRTVPLVFARGNGNVYIYTSKGVQAIMSMKYFVTPKTK